MEPLLILLDHFLDRIEADRDKVKRQVMAIIDQHFDEARQQTVDLKNKIQLAHNTRRNRNNQPLASQVDTTQHLPIAGPSGVSRVNRKRKRTQTVATKKTRTKALTERDNEREGIYHIRVCQIECDQTNCGAKLKSIEKYRHHLTAQHKLLPYSCLSLNCNARFENG